MRGFRFTVKRYYFPNPRLIGCAGKNIFFLDYLESPNHSQLVPFLVYYPRERRNHFERETAKKHTLCGDVTSI